MNKSISCLISVLILTGCTSQGIPAPYTLNVSFPVISQTQINAAGSYLETAQQLRTDDGLCLASAPEAGNSQRVRLVLQECQHQQTQFFSFHRDRIINNGLCLDAAGGETSEGTPVILYTCNGNDNQRWFEEDNTIRGIPAKKCLGTENLIVSKGDAVILTDCDFGWNLTFTTL